MLSSCYIVVFPSVQSLFTFLQCSPTTSNRFICQLQSFQTLSLLSFHILYPSREGLCLTQTPPHPTHISSLRMKLAWLRAAFVLLPQMFPLKAGPVLWSHLSHFFHGAFQHNEPRLCLLGCPLRPLLGLDVPQRSHPEKMLDSLCDTFANYPPTSIHSLAGIYVCKNFKVLRSETNLGVTKNVKQKIWGQIVLCLCHSSANFF